MGGEGSEGWSGNTLGEYSELRDQRKCRENKYGDDDLCAEGICSRKGEAGSNVERREAEEAVDRQGLPWTARTTDGSNQQIKMSVTTVSTTRSREDSRARLHRTWNVSIFGLNDVSQSSFSSRVATASSWPSRLATVKNHDYLDLPVTIPTPLLSDMQGWGFWDSLALRPQA